MHILFASVVSALIWADENELPLRLRLLPLAVYSVERNQGKWQKNETLSHARNTVWERTSPIEKIMILFPRWYFGISWLRNRMQYSWSACREQQRFSSLQRRPLILKQSWGTQCVGKKRQGTIQYSSSPKREKGLLTRGARMGFWTGKNNVFDDREREKKQRVFAPFFVCPKKSEEH